MDEIKKLNDLWHVVNMCMKREMSSGKYPATVGVSMVELSILQVIESLPTCMMKDVSNQLGLPKSTLTSAANRLEAKGYITKSPSKNDKRAYNLELTALGTQAQREHLDIEHSVLSDFFSALNREEKNSFLRMFSKAASKIT